MSGLLFLTERAAACFDISFLGEPPWNIMGALIMESLNDGCAETVPKDDGAAIFLTVCLLLVGDGIATIYAASSSMGKPSYTAMLSKSASFSTLIW